MTEIQAFLSVRKKFPLAQPNVVAWGKVECIAKGVVVATLNKDKDDKWDVTWAVEQPKAPAPVPATVPASVPASVEKS
jgi:hypothetical protein